MICGSLDSLQDEATNKASNLLKIALKPFCFKALNCCNIARYGLLYWIGTKYGLKVEQNLGHIYSLVFRILCPPRNDLYYEHSIIRLQLGRETKLLVILVVVALLDAFKLDFCCYLVLSSILSSNIDQMLHISQH
jgi:hypothetical protein